MRAVFSVVGLLLVVAVVALLARKQFASVPAPAGVASPAAAAPGATPQQQVRQFQQAVQQQMQQPRPVPDDK
jgi:hypothetical protein